jgi:hypothetical protein
MCNYEDPWRFKHHLYHHHYHHHHRHQRLHSFTSILIVIPRSHCGFAQVFSHPFVFHAYYYDDVDYLYEWVVFPILGEMKKPYNIMIWNKDDSFLNLWYYVLVVSLDLVWSRPRKMSSER